MAARAMEDRETDRQTNRQTDTGIHIRKREKGPIESATKYDFKYKAKASTRQLGLNPGG